MGGGQIAGQVTGRDYANTNPEQDRRVNMCPGVVVVVVGGY